MSSPVPVKLGFLSIEAASGTDESLTPVIFLHGLTCSKENWGDIPKRIADRTKRKVYAIDARNHGDSVFTDEFNFDINVDDLFHFMDGMNIPKAILIGHSMGGITAIKSALREPNRIEMIFVEDMITKKIPKEILHTDLLFLKLFTTCIQDVPAGSSESDAIKLTLHETMSKIPQNSPHLKFKSEPVELKLRLKRKADGRYDVSYNKEVIFKALENYEYLSTELSGQFNAPAYFLYGGLSALKVGEEEDDIRKHFPKVELIEFKEATHQVHTEYRNEFIETIVKKLS